MSKKKICFIAQFPPPMHGLSKAVETLYDSKLSSEFEFEKVDITNNKSFLKNLVLIHRSKAELFYFTIFMDTYIEKDAPIKLDITCCMYCYNDLGIS